jgi:hypothetical protein
MTMPRRRHRAGVGMPDRPPARTREGGPFARSHGNRQHGAQRDHTPPPRHAARRGALTPLPGPGRPPNHDRDRSPAGGAEPDGNRNQNNPAMLTHPAALRPAAARIGARTCVTSSGPAGFAEQAAEPATETGQAGGLTATFGIQEQGTSSRNTNTQIIWTCADGDPPEYVP